MNLSDLTQLAVLPCTLIALGFNAYQLVKVADSLRFSQESNTIGAISHFSSRYEAIINSIPNKPDSAKEQNWWYRLWDLVSQQFIMFRKGVLDADVFELWMSELSNSYQSKPMGLSYMSIRSEKHREYLLNTLPCERALHEFFMKIDCISKEPNPEVRAELVHKLVQEFAPLRGKNIVKDRNLYSHRQPRKIRR